MRNTRKQIPVILIPVTEDDFDVIKYHDDMIAGIINRFKKFSDIKRLDHRFESDYVFRESDAIFIVEKCIEMNIPFEVGYRVCYDGCWEINFKELLTYETEAI